MEIYVLRLGHRFERDKRITTHVGLVARAFGASGIYLSGDRDSKIMEGWKKVVDEFGGKFKVEYVENWRKFLKGWSGLIVHLTMYGVDIDDAKEMILSNKNKPVLLVVGGPKVEGEVYQLADFNVAVGNQPHSEVAAVAIVLDRLIGKDGHRKQFENARIIVKPNPKGKTIINKN